MNWYLETGYISRAEAQERIAGFNLDAPSASGGITSRALQQLINAKTTAAQLISDMESPKGKYRVVISGVTGPGREPWPDSISICIYTL